MNHFIPYKALSRAAIIISAAVLTLSFSSCSTRREQAAQLNAAMQIDKLQKQVNDLQDQLDKKTKELDNCVILEKELNNLVVQAYNHESWQELYMYAGTAIKLFPSSTSSNAFKNYFKLASEQMNISPDNNGGTGGNGGSSGWTDFSSETGIWKLAHFVDSNGNPNGKPYLTTTDILKGTYTNKDNSNAYLEVYPIISSDSNIAFMLYENGGDTEVRGSRTKPVSYEVTVLDGDTDSHTLRATNNSDRVILDKTNSQKLHRLLQNGGFIQITLKATVNSQQVVYKFNIQDATFYNNAYRQLYAELY